MKVTFISTVSATSLTMAAQKIWSEFGLDLKIDYPRTLLREDLKKSDAVFDKGRRACACKAMSFTTP